VKQRILFFYIFREHAVPFLGANAVISFLFLSNFILKSLDRLLGKDLGFLLITEFIFLNLAWIIAMAVPMSVLIAVLMVFGRLGEDNEITAVRASGISFSSVLLPALSFAVLVMGFLLFFNDNILPDSNHKARLLRGDIYRKHPDLNLEPGYFIYDIPDYTLFMRNKNNETMEDLIIFHSKPNGSKITIWAETGVMDIRGNYVILTLSRGEIHELPPDAESSEYRVLDFTRHRISIPVENMMLERRDTARKGDREMDIATMRGEIEGYERRKATIYRQTLDLIPFYRADSSLRSADFSAIDRLIADSLASLKQTGRNLNTQELKVQRSLENTRRRAESNGRIYNSYQKQINKYLVEIHKKIAMPVACIIFIMVGAPLGMMARRGGMAIAAAVSLVFFLVYWAMMMGGEQLSDRNMLSPWIAMWSPNIIFFLTGIFLIWYAIHERISISLPRFIKPFLNAGDKENGQDGVA